MCILEDMCRLIDTIISMRQYPMRNQGLIQRLGRQITASIKTDQRCRVYMSGKYIEKLLASTPPP